MDDSFAQMREYIMVTEHLVQAEFGEDDEKLIEVEIPPESISRYWKTLAELFSNYEPLRILPRRCI